MNEKLSQFERLASFNGMLKFSKESYFYLMIVLIHLFFVVMVAIFVSMFIDTSYVFDYTKAYFSKDIIIFSKSLNIELLRKDFLDIYFIKSLKQAVYFICFTIAIYSALFLFINKQIKAFIKMLNKNTGDKILQGSVILQDNEFMSKYISLRKNDKNGIFISQIYKFEEVDKNGNIIEN